MTTLSLNSNWDLMIDNNGNIALITDEQEIAQNVATSCRVFKGEEPFDVERGIPYKTQIMGEYPDSNILNAYFEKEAKRISGVENITVLNSGFVNRTLYPDIEIQTETGSIINV